MSEFNRVQDSGERQEFDTGAVRDTANGKGRYDLLPAYAIYRVARHFENGAVKYADENWRKGMPLRRYLDSAMRHLFKFLEGQRDEDHAAAAAWNILCLIETEEMIRRGILPQELANLPDWTGNAFKLQFVGEQPGVEDEEDEEEITAEAEREYARRWREVADRYDGKWVNPGGFIGSIKYVEIQGKQMRRVFKDGTVVPVGDGEWEPLDGIPCCLIDVGYWVPYEEPKFPLDGEYVPAHGRLDPDYSHCLVEKGRAYFVRQNGSRRDVTDAALEWIAEGEWVRKGE